MNFQELLMSNKNRQLLLETIYFMIGIDLNEDEKITLRFHQILSDLEMVLNDVNTDFIKVLQMLKCENNFKTINKQIALFVFESYEHRNEKFFIEENRKRQLENNVDNESQTLKKTEEKEDFSKRSEVLLFNDTFETFEYKVSPSNRFGFFYSDSNQNNQNIIEDFMSTPRMVFSNLNKVDYKKA